MTKEIHTKAATPTGKTPRSPRAPHGVSLLAQYTAYMATPHWRSLRRSVLSSAGFKCEACYATSGLVGHHMFYRENMTDSKIEDLMCLCEDCHNLLHRYCKTSRTSVPREKLKTMLLISEIKENTQMGFDDARNRWRKQGRVILKEYRNILKRFSRLNPTMKNLNLIQNEIENFKSRIQSA